MIFTHYSQRDRQAIECVQRMFTKALFPLTCKVSYYNRCTQLNLEPLWLRRMKLNLAILHRLIYSQMHTSIVKPVFSERPEYMLRDNTFKLQYKTSKTSVGHNSFLSLYSRLWNKLPLHIRSIESNLMFTRSLNLFLSPEKVESLLGIQLSLDVLFESGPKNI